MAPIKLSILLFGVCAIALMARFAVVETARADQLPVSTVVFDREIVAILNAHCVTCHRVGGVSFPLETYEQTFFKRNEIRAQALERHMPPWPAVP